MCLLTMRQNSGMILRAIDNGLEVVMIMNRNELIASMAEKSGLSKKDVGTALDAFTAAVQETFKSGDKVQLVGFGTFEVKERAARTGKNPRTGKTVEIPAAKVPVFKAGKALKDALN